MTALKYVDTLPRNISPASIQIGDTIRVSWTQGDVKHAVTGTVAKREYDGATRLYTTPGGNTLLVWHPEYKTHTVTLLAVAPPANLEQLPLFEGLRV